MQTTKRKNHLKEKKQFVLNDTIRINAIIKKKEELDQIEYIYFVK